MQQSRIEIARRRLRIARISLGTLAAAGFAVFAFAARAAHPGTSEPATDADTQITAVTSDDDEYGDDFGFGSSSISPSYGDVPSAQSGGS
jgi:hypothetical protein